MPENDGFSINRSDFSVEEIRWLIEHNIELLSERRARFISEEAAAHMLKS